MLNPVHLYVAARSPRDVYGLDDVRDLQRHHPALTLQVCVSASDGLGQHRRGLVVEAIERELGSLAGWHAYLYGSPPMVEATAILARRKGINAGSIHAEAFYTAPS